MPNTPRPSSRELLPRLLLFALAAVVIAHLVILGWGRDERALAQRLDRPEWTAIRVSERDLADAAAAASGPAWVAAAARLLGFDAQAMAQSVVARYREVLRLESPPSADPQRPSASDEVRARLALLLAEQERHAEARRWIAEMETEGPAAEWAAALRYAYGYSDVPASARLDGGPGADWSAPLLAYRLRIRAAPAESDAAAEAWGRSHERRLAGWYSGLAGLLLLAIAGLLAIRHVDRRIAPPEPPPALAPVLAIGLIVLLEFWRVAFGYLSWILPASVAWVAYEWHALAVGLPFLWLLAKAARREGVALARAIRWRAPAGGWRGGLAIVVAGLAADVGGAMLWLRLSGLAGVPDDWVESVSETLIWSGPASVAVAGVGVALWAPVFEEIAYRGVLFAALAGRFGWPMAAGMSAAWFAAIHVYSAAGFVVVLWSGLVLAWVLRRSGSLPMAILVHALSNLAWFGAVIGYYR